MGIMITLNQLKIENYKDVGNKEIVINSDNILVMEDSVSNDSRNKTEIKFINNDTLILVVESKEEVQSKINGSKVDLHS